MTADDPLLDLARTEAPEIAPYLVADDQSMLSLPRCGGCGHLQWPPRPFCAQCGGGDFEAASVVPRGELYSWTTTHRPPTADLATDVPYTVVLVTLLDVPGRPRLLGRLDDEARSDDLVIGLAMRGVRHQRDNGLPLLVWSVDD